MTTRALVRPLALWADGARAAAGLVFLAVAGASVGWLAADTLNLRLALAAALATLAVGVATVSPKALLVGVVVWLSALGTLRRVVAGVAGDSSYDLLLLVGPLALALLVAVAVTRGGFAARGALANAVLALAVLSLAGVFNPLQGSLAAGVAGLLFVFVPMLAFWIGRGLCTDRTLRLVLLLVAALGIPAALYGLAQTFLGFPAWDTAWIEKVGADYLGLLVGAAIRPFSSFSSAAEYAVFVALALVVWVAFGFRSLRIPFVIAPIGLLVTALVVSSTRGAVVVAAAALSLMACASRRLPILPALALSAVLLVGLSAGAQRIGTPDSTGATSTLVSHQIGGLADPLDPTALNLGVHLSLIGSGLRSALDDPFGVGIGSVNLAAVKFGGEIRSTEADPSNIAVALGIPGLVAYLLIVVLGFRKAYELARRRRDALSLAVLGVLAVTALQWLNGGHYAVAILPWLVLGWVDRSSPRRR